MSGGSWSEYLQDCWADLLAVLDRIAAALEKLADAKTSGAEGSQESPS